MQENNGEKTDGGLEKKKLNIHSTEAVEKLYKKGNIIIERKLCKRTGERKMYKRDHIIKEPNVALY